MVVVTFAALFAAIAVIAIVAVIAVTAIVVAAANFVLLFDSAHCALTP